MGVILDVLVFLGKVVAQNLSSVKDFLLALGGIVSVLVSIVSLRYQRKIMENNVRDRERPVVIETVRYFLSPSIKWFGEQIKSGSFNEFNPEKFAKDILNYVRGHAPPPNEYPTRLLSVLSWYKEVVNNFRIILEKYKKKDMWEHLFSKYNECVKKRPSDAQETAESIVKLLEDIKRRLRKDYNLLTSEMAPAVDFSSPSNILT